MEGMPDEPSPAHGVRKPLTSREKQRGAMMFAGLIVASVIVKSVWPYSGVVAPAVVADSNITFQGVYLRAADDRGDADAMYLLAEMYLEGSRVPKDLVEAQKWCRLSAMREPLKPVAFRQSRNSQSVRDRWANYYASPCGPISQALTAEQLADAANRASEWLAAFETRKK
jgi:hypothetical protein